MTANHKSLKQRQRDERHSHGEGLALRVHRALSWLDRAEQCGDDDGQFVFLWIAFNAAYAREFDEERPRESERHSDFLKTMVDLDKQNQLANIVWQHYSGAIRVLLDNRYVYQPFWNHQNGIPGYKDWEERFGRAKAAANHRLASKDTAVVLSIVFDRLYTLRNQIIHGGATWNSSVNRQQLRDATRLLADIVPVIIEVMMDNVDRDWGEACYPVRGLR